MTMPTKPTRRSPTGVMTKTGRHSASLEAGGLPFRHVCGATRAVVTAIRDAAADDVHSGFHERCAR